MRKIKEILRLRYEAELSVNAARNPQLFAAAL